MSRALPPVPPLSQRARVTLAVIVALGALLRMAWVVIVGEWPDRLADPNRYLHLATMVADGNGYGYKAGSEIQPTAYYPPGYPLVLGGLLRLVAFLPFGVSPVVVALGFNAAASVATIVLVFELGRRLVDVQVALVAAAIFAAWPNVIFQTGAVLTEPFFLFLFVSMLLVALASPETAHAPGRRRLVAIGLLFGAAGLVRPTSLVLAPLFLVLWWPSGARTALRRTAVIGVAAMVVVLPWTARNLVASGEPVLISTNMGDNLCFGHHPHAQGGYNESCLRDENGVPIPEMNDVMPGETRLEYEIRRQDELMRQARSYIRDDPARVLTGMPAKLRWTLNGDTDGLQASGDYRLPHEVDEYWAGTAIGHRGMLWLADGANLYYVVAMTGAVSGLVLLLQRRDAARRRVFFVSAALIQLVPPALTFGDMRFKAPLYPAAAIGAAVALMAVAALVRRSPGDDRQAGDGEKTVGATEETPVRVGDGVADPQPSAP